MLDRNRGHEESEIDIADSLVKIFERGADFSSVGDLVGRQSKLWSGGAGHFPRYKGERNRQGMSGLQAPYNHIDDLGQLLAKFRNASGSENLEDNHKQRRRH